MIAHQMGEKKKPPGYYVRGRLVIQLHIWEYDKPDSAEGIEVFSPWSSRSAMVWDAHYQRLSDFELHETLLLWVYSRHASFRPGIDFGVFANLRKIGFATCSENHGPAALVVLLWRWFRIVGVIAVVSAPYCSNANLFASFFLIHTSVKSCDVALTIFHQIGTGYRNCHIRRFVVHLKYLEIWHSDRLSAGSFSLWSGRTIGQRSVTADRWSTSRFVGWRSPAFGCAPSWARCRW